MSSKATTHVRYLVILMLFVASTFSYGDRIVLSIAAVSLMHDLHLDPLHQRAQSSRARHAWHCHYFPS